MGAKKEVEGKGEQSSGSEWEPDSDSDFMPSKKKRRSSLPKVEPKEEEDEGEGGAEGNVGSLWPGLGYGEEELKRLLDGQNTLKEDLKQEGGSALHSFAWHRVILDEAHKIKGRTNSTAKAVLELDPHAYYFCRCSGCDCKSLNWEFGPMQRHCVQCGHSAPRHYSKFNRDIINPVSRYGYATGEGQRGLQELEAVLKRIQLRRTKAQRSADINIPPLTIRIVELELSEAERDFYESLY